MANYAYQPGQLLGRQDLSIFLADPKGQPFDPYLVTYALYFVDPGPPEVEVLIGSPAREPAHPAMGEYYAAILIPTGAQVGTYRIRWTLQQTAGSPVQHVVQEFKVVSTPVVLVSMSPTEEQAVRELRMLLRDHCLGGEEVVEVDADGHLVQVDLETLYEVLADLQVSSPVVLG